MFHCAGRGWRNGKESTQWKYIICLFANEFTEKLANGNMKQSLSYKEYLGKGSGKKKCRKHYYGSLRGAGAME